MGRDRPGGQQYGGRRARGAEERDDEHQAVAVSRDRVGPVIVTLMRWGDQYLAGDDGPPLVLQHRCVHQLVTQVVCQACGEPLHARDTRPVTAG